MTIHTAVIDAGSSGTRLFLYRVEPGTLARVEKLLEREFATMASGAKEDGINNFVGVDPTDPARDVVSETIDPLLAALTTFLDGHGVPPADVEVHLLATAGMRYAETLHGRDAVGRLYDTIRAGIRRRGFPTGEIRTTCGSEEEGVWTWVNLNDVLFRTFDGDDPPMGVVEVGGSSLQLTFATDEDPDLVPHVHRVTLGGRSFAVSCRSFLGLGQDDARKAMRVRLGPRGSAVCFPRGFRADKDHGDVLDGVGSHRLAADGAFDYAACVSAYEAILVDRLAAAGTPDLTHARGDFVGIDGVYYATSYWGIEEEPDRLPERIVAAAADVSHFPEIDSREFVQAQAANATYVQALLTFLFAGTPRRLVRAVATRVDGETRLTWTRGFLLCRHSSS